MRQTMRFLILAVGILLVPVATSSAVVIDTFDDGTDTVVKPGLLGPSNTATAEALGGSRTLAIIDAASVNGTTLSADDPNTQDSLDHGQGPGGAGASMVTWDANGAGLGGIDLTELGSSDGVSLDVLAIDVGAVTLTLTINDTGVGSSSLVLGGLVEGVQGFFFDDFTGDADFTDVDSIVLRIDANANSDLRIDIIESTRVPNGTAPEPSSIALAICGLLGLAMGRRRRRRA